MAHSLSKSVNELICLCQCLPGFCVITSWLHAFHFVFLTPSVLWLFRISIYDQISLGAFHYWTFSQIFNNIKINKRYSVVKWRMRFLLAVFRHSNSYIIIHLILACFRCIYAITSWFHIRACIRGDTYKLDRQRHRHKYIYPLNVSVSTYV